MPQQHLWPIGHAIPRPEWGRYLSPRWHAARASGAYVGSSTVAAILGLSPWAGPWEAWRRLTGQSDPVQSTEAMQLGLDVEPVIAKWWRRKRPDVVDHWRTKLTYGHPTIYRLGASVDAVGRLEDGRQVLGEFKHLHWRAQDELDAFSERGSLTGGLVPIFIQVQSQLAVTGLDVCHLSALVEKRTTVLEIGRDAHAISRIETEVPAFLERFVDTGTEPPAGAADAPGLRSFYPASDPGSELERTDLAEDVARGRELKARARAKKAEAKAIERELDPIKAKLMQAMGEAERLHVGGAKPVTWKTNRAGRRSLLL